MEFRHKVLEEATGAVAVSHKVIAHFHAPLGKTLAPVIFYNYFWKLNRCVNTMTDVVNITMPPRATNR